MTASKKKLLDFLRRNHLGAMRKARPNEIARGLYADMGSNEIPSVADGREVAKWLRELATDGAVLRVEQAHRKTLYWYPSTDGDGPEMERTPPVSTADQAAQTITETRLRDENTMLRAQIKEISRQRIKDDTLSAVYADAMSAPMAEPEWLVRPPRNDAGRNVGVHHATACICVCDTHYDEVVDPAQVMGKNAYDREIAERRTERLAANAIKMLRRYTAGVTLDGVCVFQAGDILSGMIHDELRQTNAASITVSVVHWAERLAAVYGAWADEFGRVAVHIVAGNHGRLDRKPRAKGGVQDNFDYLLGALVAKRFANDDRVSVVLAESFDLPVTVYDTRFLLTHGDQARGGSGIAGAMSPMLIMDARKRKNHAYDWLVCGHWHQYMPGWRGIMMGGALKGIDEYGLRSNFAIEEPTQALWLVTTERGVTQTAPIFVEKKGVIY